MRRNYKTRALDISFLNRTLNVELVGFTSCGGCPGKRVPLRVRELVKRGADTIVFASCIKKGTPIAYPCPFARRLMDLASAEAGEGVKILDWTH